MELSVKNVVTLLPTTKAERETFIELLKQHVLNGDIDPAELHLRLSIFEKLIKDVKDDKEIKEEVLRAADKWKGEVIFGHKINVKEKKNYDYNFCCDPDWEQGHAMEKKWSEYRKNREKMLSALTEDVANMDGVVIHPPQVSITRYVEVREEK